MNQPGSAGPFPLQAGLLDIQVVVEAAGDLGGDRAPLTQAAQLLPLDPEQVVDQLGNGPGPVRLAVGGLLVQVRDRAAIQAMLAGAPYVQAGLYTSLEIHDWQFGGRASG